MKIPSLRSRRLARSAGAAIGSAALASAAALFIVPNASAAVTMVSDPASLVNTIVGTSGAVDTFPGPAVPFGMTQWSPDTSPDRPAGGGYEYNDKSLQGFSLTHISGPGCAASGDIPILPVVGDVGSNPGSLTTPYTHDGEQSQAGFYQVTSGSGSNAVTTALTRPRAPRWASSTSRSRRRPTWSSSWTAAPARSTAPAPAWSATTSSPAR